MATPSESRAELFKLEYFGQTAYLAQSPQLFKQMAIAAGLVIDLNGPAGNIFYLMGTCNRLVRELGLSVQLKREYETEINSANDCQSHLTIMQKWFGIVFVE